MKNTKKNNDSQPELLDGKTPKPISGEWGTAAQISALLPFASEIDETFLRNRAREINPRTSQPWIPKPVNNQFEIRPTVIGLLEWFHAKANEKDGLPTAYDSLQAMENALRLSRRVIKFLIKNGAEDAQHQGSRIDPRPVLDRANKFLGALADGTIEGIDGIEQFNKDRSLALKLDEETAALKRKAKLEAGEMLLSKDDQWAIHQLKATELIEEKMLQPLRTALLNAPKTINRQHKTILHGTDPEKIRKAADVVQASIAEVLNKIRQKIPKRLPEDDGEK